MELTPMQTLLNTIETFITSVFGEWLDYVLDAIIETPVLTLFVVAVPLVGIAVGIFNRLVRSN